MQSVLPFADAEPERSADDAAASPAGVPSAPPGDAPRRRARKPALSPPVAEELDIVLVDPPPAAPRTHPVQVVVDATLRWQIAEYVRADLAHEGGGLVLGHYQAGDGGTVYLEEWLPATAATATESSLTFTYAAWAELLARHEAEFPEKRIVGWFHSHPGMGIFLSEFDRHIQEHFFGLPWQVAYVVDPVAGTEGLFRWEANRLSKTLDYTVRGLLPTEPPAPRPTPPAPAESLPPPSDAPAPPRRAARAARVPRPRHPLADVRHLLILLLAGTSVYLGWLRPQPVRTIIQRVPAPVRPAPSPPAPAVATTSTATELRYTVQADDSLWTICARHYPPGTDLLAAIARVQTVNALTTDRLDLGMQLRLPGARPAAAASEAP
jgi:proteasome lid subunit RPN8/RPN11